jgi:heme o synthase
MISAGAYYRLCKPGIVYGNALVAAAGFAYAARGHIDWLLFLYMLLGLSLVIASACVFNNYFDRGIDAKMERTKNRPLVVGHISSAGALSFGTLLGIAGAMLLFFITPQALWVGAIAGATPPVVGYVAVTNSLDYTALWLFIFLFIWQVPHFLGIAAYRYDEYAAAGIPLLLSKPSGRGKAAGRIVFYISLAVLLAWCGALMLHR